MPVNQSSFLRNVDFHHPLMDILKIMTLRTRLISCFFIFLLVFVFKNYNNPLAGTNLTHT